MDSRDGWALVDADIMDELLEYFAVDLDSDVADASRVAVSDKENNAGNTLVGISYPHCVKTSNTNSDEGTTLMPTDTRPGRKTFSAGASARSINVSRERKRQEIDELRRSAVALQRQLERLQQHRDEMLRSHRVGSTGQLVTAAPVWEDMAKRQFQARKEAEMDTTKLRRRLAQQALVTQKLIYIICQAQHLEKECNSTGLVLLPPPSPSRHHRPVQPQLDRLPALCAQWFIPLSWYAQKHSTQLQFLESFVLSDDGVETVVDICANQAFPFPVAHVDQAIWELFQAERTEEDYAYAQNPEISPDTITSNFTITTNRDGVDGSMSGTYVSRKFRNDHGQSVIASTTCASFDGVDGSHSFDLTEDTWMRTLDARTLRGAFSVADSTELTILQHVRRSRIRLVDGLGSESKGRVRELMQLHLKLVETQLRWGQDGMESQLMQRFTSSRSPPIG